MSVLYELSRTYKLDYKYNTFYITFKWSLSAQMVGLRVLVIGPMGSIINNQHKSINH